jgi:serine/threonine protein kinase
MANPASVAYASVMGDRLGRYVVVKHLATGGMADVLLGRSEGIEGFARHVVLKRIRPEHARDQRFIRMFLDEARVAANLHHQHIVQVHDVGEAAGEYFIAMEYLHGEDVRVLLTTAAKQRTHVPLGIAVAVVSAAAAGLHYAHERRGSDRRSLGIVHRDVSPSNLLVGHDGSVKIVDFGIAKASMSQDTQSGTLKGKLSYMSPEQCKGGAVDCRSDVYALGVVLYELATTTRLFRGDNDYLLMEQIVHGRITAPHVRRPDLSRELSAIIMRALATDVDRRYATADELRAALDQFASRAGITASPSTIAAYMREQFGDRPEPWAPVGEPATEPAREPGFDASQRQTSARVVPVAATAPEPVRAPLQILAPPTDSKLGWESQKRAHARRGVTASTLAIACTSMLVVLSVAGWRIGTRGGAPGAASAPLVVEPATPVLRVTPLDPPAPAQLDAAVIAQVAASHRRELALCKAGEASRGEVTVRFAVDAAGRISQRPVTTATASAKAVACVVRAMATWQWAAPGPAGAQGSYTLSFP